ncbi:hypothetical protein [Paenibacillus sp. LPE1-1-1.1]|uniref:hypothetical protein n=1 Tax=Paenibacillus sp. LPE1-1-1.1 TaxID=3135230 RepID=UPI00343DB74C
MLNVISNGIFDNNASTSVTMSDGTNYNMAQTALGGMNAWNNATEAHYPELPSSCNSEIEAYGQNYGNLENNLNGWVEMYEDWDSTSDLNPDATAPTSDGMNR